MRHHYLSTPIKACCASLLLMCLSAPSSWAQGVHPNLRKTIESLEKVRGRITLADTTKKEDLGAADYQIYYQKTYHPIPSTSQPTLQWTQVLQVGKDYHRFIDRGKIQEDFILDASLRSGKNLLEIVSEQRRLASPSRSHEDIIFNLRSDSLDLRDMVFIDKYCYLEPIPHMDWTLLDGDTIVAGYRCQRASTHFRGRDYTAWYTEEIQLPYGPYKFRGLPGLILCLYDTARDHVFTLSGLVQGGGKWIYRKTSKNLFVIRRAQMRSMKQNYADHPDGYKSEGIVKRTGPIRKQKILYNPIELE